jgi:Uma2 family endonuclease
MAAPTLEPTLRRLTRAEYDRMVALGFFRGERLELIHGSLLRMPPIGPPHASVVSRLNRLLLPRLVDRADVRIQQPLVAHDDSEPEPDVAIVPLADYSASHPDRALLVIEVADSSIDFDRATKGPLYAASNVGEYWIVDLGAKTIEVYTEPSEGRFARLRYVRGEERVRPGAFPDIEVGVRDLLGAG